MATWRGALPRCCAVFNRLDRPLATCYQLSYGRIDTSTTRLILAMHWTSRSSSRQLSFACRRILAMPSRGIQAHSDIPPSIPSPSFHSRSHSHSHSRPTPAFIPAHSRSRTHFTPAPLPPLHRVPSTFPSTPLMQRRSAYHRVRRARLSSLMYAR